MRRKRRNHSPAFKAKVTLEAAKEEKTLAKLAQQYELHVNQISTWKQELSHENMVGIRLEDGRTFLLRSLKPQEVAKVLEILKRCAPQAQIARTMV